MFEDENLSIGEILPFCLESGFDDVGINKAVQIFTVKFGNLFEKVEFAENIVESLGFVG